MKYAAVGFDWGGVINGEPGFVFTEKICEFLSIDEPTYKDIYFRHNRAFNAGKPISETELWTRVLRDLGFLDRLDDVMKFVIEYRQTKSLNQPILDLVDKLRSDGYKTGLLSNNSVDAANMMREAGVDAHFDAFIVSAEVGLMKPDPDLYKLFCKQLGIDPKQLVFIDDSRRALESADECGYTPVLFRSFDSLMSDLKSLNVL
ncbi:HAD family phosphatase [Candidatus Saccharibacteria bacterium]|nr:HAD family phosphatase [Candidatus Saccharibacteria bacterium]